ncbi:MAG: tetratricopeptide repeat protein [Acidobacteria bacterium]|nr:tetratricopeptide repeat protein [Acidobacteriota bacterium]MBI3421564.1 tetratricopeptide repeat protein [Acidobacteriota bacterium]
MIDRKKLLYGVAGLLVGLAVGYWATDSLNRNFAGAAQSERGAAQNAELPPDHPPMGGATGAGSRAETADASTGGEPQAEVAAVLQQARNEPSNFEAQMKAGNLFSQIKRYEQALEFYGKAQQLKPKEHGLLVALGNANFDLQRYPAAERWYKEALKLKPEDVDARTDLGLSYFLREPKELDKAIAEYRTSLGYNPRHEQSLQNLITALLAKGDKAAVQPYLQQLEQVNPQNQALAQFRAQLN